VSIKNFIGECFGLNKKANENRTASTVYPCFLPDLGDSTGAGRIRLPMQI